MATRPGILGRLSAAASALRAPAEPRLDSALTKTEPAQPQATTRADGWKNVLTGLGTWSHDKRKHSRFLATRITWTEAEELWRGEGIGARIVELLPKTMTRKGWEVHVADDKDIGAAINKELARWNSIELFYDALSKQRGFGGAGIILGVNDGKDPAEPLDLDMVESLDWTNVLSAHELPAHRWYEDAGAANYGMPMQYLVNPQFTTSGGGTYHQGTVIHESRVIAFRGVPISRRQLYENRGWGDSVFVRVLEAVSELSQGMSGASALLQDFAQGVISLKGLVELLSGGEGADQVLKERLRILDMTRSVFKSMVLDSEDKFERKQTPMSGYPETLQQLMLRLSAVTGYPVTVLMGQSPAGLNATGDSDIRSFYDVAASEQNVVLLPRMNQFLKVLYRSKRGPTGGVEPKNSEIKFHSLYTLTEKEEAEVRKTQAETDKIYIEARVVAADEIANSRFQGGSYSTATVLDQGARNAAKNKASPSVALAGPQATAMSALVKSVASGEIPRASGIELLVASYPIDHLQAERIMANAGAGFVPTAVDPKVALSARTGPAPSNVPGAAGGSESEPTAPDAAAGQDGLDLPPEIAALLARAAIRARALQKPDDAAPPTPPAKPTRKPRRPKPQLALPLPSQPVAASPAPEAPPARLPPQAEPAADSAPGAPPAAEATRLNGAQVQSVVDVVHAVAKGHLPRATGMAILVNGLMLTPAQAEEIMGEVGKTFTREPAEP